MNQSINIKVCGITRWEDMKQLGEMGVQYGGMIFYDKSPRFAEGKMDAGKVRAFKKIKKVGVFVNADKNYILKQVEKYQFDLLQLHGEETPSFCNELRQYLPIIKAFRIKDENDLKKLDNYTGVCDYFLFDTYGKLYGGNGRVFNWKLLDEYKNEVPFFLSGGIGMGEVEQIKSFSHPALFAVDVNSRFETEPGIKNINELKQFICRLNSN